MSVSRERARIMVLHADNTDLSALEAELDAFWTKGCDVESITVELTADEGFIDAFEDEAEVEGAVIEAKADYEE